VNVQNVRLTASTQATTTLILVDGVIHSKHGNVQFFGGLGTRNFAVAGAKILNSLPADLRFNAQSIWAFAQKLKQYLFMCYERI